MTKTITLLAGGTRGDVQPYIALGIGLRQAGYRVRVAAHDAFAPLISSWGLDFFPLGENPSDLFYRAENRDAFRAGKNPLVNVRASYKYWQMARPVYAQLVKNAWLVVQDSSALIFGLPMFWAGAFAGVMQIPGVRGYMQPLTPTRAYPCPLLPLSRSYGATFNRLSYTLCFALMDWAWRDALRAWQNRFHIARASASKQEILTLYAYSQHLVPRPPDFPENHQITGYWFLPERTWIPSVALESFLNAGEPPVYVGFGSALAGEARDLAALLAEVQHTTTQRFLVPPALANETLQRAAVCTIGDVPHSWLFPRVRAVMHHGGAGTTAAALRAGVPQSIVPMYSDSYFWGARVFASGAGTEPLPENRLSADTMTRAINAIAEDETLRDHARSFAKSIAGEDGVKNAVAYLRVLV